MPCGRNLSETREQLEDSRLRLAGRIVESLGFQQRINDPRREERLGLVAGAVMAAGLVLMLTRSSKPDPAPAETAQTLPAPAPAPAAPRRRARPRCR